MENIPIRKLFVTLFVLVMVSALFFGCGSDPGWNEMEQFYSGKVAAVNEAANLLAAANKPEEAVAAMEKGFKALKEAIAEEAALFKKYPDTEKNPAVKKLQDDYLLASDKFSKEVETLPNRFIADAKLIEALGRMKNRF